jgi:hypothetical protein
MCIDYSEFTHSVQRFQMSSIDQTAVIAAIASLIGAAVGSFVGYFSTRLQVYAQTRSTNRKVWMNRVIETVRDLVVVCKHEPNEIRALTRLVTELDMLLNLENHDKMPETDGLQKTLVEIRGYRTEEEWRNFSKETSYKLVQPVKLILAQEWKLVMAQK